jgi:hypothetical protein
MARSPGTDARAAARALMLALLLCAAPASSQVRVVAVEPAREGNVLQCTIVIAGLPDGPSRETLASGLPSSLTLSLAVLDGAGRERGATRTEVRIEPDPWERSFRVRWPGAERRARGLDDLAAILSRLGPVSVAPLRASDDARSMRVRARLAVHALAPAEADEARALVSGQMGGGGSDRREVSAGLGGLLRFFLGRSPADAWTAQGVSAPFEPRALARTSAP